VPGGRVPRRLGLEDGTWGWEFGNLKSQTNSNSEIFKIGNSDLFEI
jgi:hypothetical protein